MMMASGASEELPVGIAPARLPTTLFPAAFKGYTATLNDANNTRLFFLRRTTTTQGTTPLLLIHGYPQTHSLWYRFVQKIPATFDVLIPDLPGYGESTKTILDDQHTAHSKRAMAKDLVTLVDLLYGKQAARKFIAYGHDRGARVAHRMALDHADRLLGVALLDIVPTTSMWEQMRLDNGRHKETLGSFHWIFLTSPVAETLISNSHDVWIKHCVNSWTGSQLKGKYEQAAMTSWVDPFAKASVVRASCEDYRAGATRDIEAEAADEHKLTVPTLILYSSFLARFDVQAIWRNWVEPDTKLRQLQAGGSDVGHFLPTEAVDECWNETSIWMRQDLGLEM